MSAFGISELFVVFTAMALPCLGFLIVGAIIIVVLRLRQNKDKHNS